jgi:hypothetical protein
LLQVGARIDRIINRIRLDSRTQADWSQIRRDLRLIGDFFGGRYNNGGYNGRDDGYGRGNDRNRRNNNDDW